MSKIIKRDKSVDVLKALCLIFMVLGHCGFPCTQFIYLFHMPLFFMASGYLFNKNKVITTEGLKKFFCRKIKTLWLPYVFWNTAFLAMQNGFLKIHFYTCNPAVLNYSGSSIQDYITIKQFFTKFAKILLFKSGTLFTSAFWFIRALFIVEITFAVLTYVLSRIEWKKNFSDTIMGVISILSLLFGYFLSLEHIQLLDLSNCFVGFTLFWLGTMMRKQNITSITEKKPFIVLAFIVLLFLNTQGVILLNQNEFTNPTFLICSALSGWIFILGIAKKLSPIDRVSNYAYYINQAAIDIMALHFIGFKAVAAVQVVIRGLPIYHLARFPILDGSNGWWVVYFFCGFFPPLLFDRVKNYELGKVREWVKQKKNQIRKT